MNSKSKRSTSQFYPLDPIRAQYLKMQKLGEGTYGDVFLAKERLTDKRVALKKLKGEFFDEGIPATAMREISVLKELNHCNIVCLLDVIIYERNIWLIFEYLETDLRKYLDTIPCSLSSEILQSLSKQLLQGLAYCHKRRILHRDLKPQNILLDVHGQIKIADFGLARACSVPMRAYTVEVVTLWYRAPELLLGCETYSFPVDVWATACIIAELATQRVPFCGMSETDQLLKIFDCLGVPSELTWPGVTSLPNFPSTKLPIFFIKQSVLGSYCDPLLHDLVTKMLPYDPANRLSAVACLSHPYFGTPSAH